MIGNKDAYVKTLAQFQCCSCTNLGTESDEDILFLPKARQLIRKIMVYVRIYNLS